MEIISALALVGHIDWVWVVVNILLPPLVPMFGMLQVPGDLLLPELRANATALGTIRDGQLAWISVLWNVATAYELVESVERGAKFEHWMYSMLGFQTLLLLRGMSIAANGALTAGANQNDKTLLFTSILLTFVSGFLFILIHTRVH